MLEAVTALSDGGTVRAADLPSAVGATTEAEVAVVERALRLALVAALVYPDDDARETSADEIHDPTTSEELAPENGADGSLPPGNQIDRTCLRRATPTYR